MGDKRGSITIIAALCLVVLVAAAAIALDLAKVYLTKSADQRIADQSALAAAFAYGQSSNSTITAQQAATSFATSNGATGATVTTQIVNSPKNNGNKAAMVVVTTPVSLSPFGQATAPALLGSVSVSATSYAEIHNAIGPCLLALGNGGLTSSGGTSVTATGCAAASTGNVTASGSGSITAQAIYAVGSITASGGASIQSSPTAGQLYPSGSAEPDPYSSANVFSRLPTVAAMATSSFPSVGSAPSGGSTQTCTTVVPILTVGPGQHGTVSTTYYPACTIINFTGGAETDISGGGLSLSGAGVVMNFAPGTYKINGIYASGATPVIMNLTGAGPWVFYIWPTTAGSNGIDIEGSASLTVNGGPATFYVQGGIKNGSGGAMSFLNTGSSTFYVAGGINIANGPGIFPNGYYTITSGDSGNGAGIDVNGGSTATFGNGSFNIAGGILLGGSANLTLGSQLDANSVFQIPSVAKNNDAILTGGGSTLTLGAFTNYDIDGPVVIQGNFYPGAGTYTINGAFNAAAAGGCCITGTGVSFITSGAVTFGAGYSTISLSAPTAITNATQGTLSTVAIASNSATASAISAGASNTTIVGGIYLPNAALELGGAGRLTGGGGCLMVVANSLTFDGGSSASTTCPNLTSTATGSGVALVQ